MNWRSSTEADLTHLWAVKHFEPLGGRLCLVAASGRNLYVGELWIDLNPEVHPWMLRHAVDGGGLVFYCTGVSPARADPENGEVFIGEP